MAKKEIDGFKKEVKRATGMALKDIVEISMFSASKIEFGFYKTNYDRVTQRLSYVTINR